MLNLIKQSNEICNAIQNYVDFLKSKNRLKREDIYKFLIIQGLEYLPRKSLGDDLIFKKDGLEIMVQEKFSDILIHITGNNYQRCYPLKFKH